jgi:hypothetical protein
MIQSLSSFVPRLSVNQPGSNVSMRWWIDVLTPLANVTKSLGKKSRSHRVGASGYQ